MITALSAGSRMLPTFIALLLLVNISANGQKREAYYHTDEMPNAIYYLPEPPDTISAQFAFDMNRYFWGKSIRETERGEMAKADVSTSMSYMCHIFSEPMGITLSQEDTPEIYTLLENSLKTTAKGASRAKSYYARVRPCQRFHEPTATGESLGQTSYPSGHTLRGWACALILVEINPECQDAILKRGYEYGQSRVIVGAHWQSDVDAGRVVASACFARLHCSDEYLEQLQRAKDEFRQITGQVITEVNETTLEHNDNAAHDTPMYTIDGHRATASTKGVVVGNGQKILRR